ncbi:MAG: GNAT family N-acetyltransferase [Sandaracinaceae bacterium]
MRFRDAEVADLPFVLAGLEENRRLEGRPEASVVATERDRREYEQAVATGTLRVLEEGGQALGFLSYRLDVEVLYVSPPFLWIDLVFVAEEQRGRGLGRRLYAEAARLAQEAGCARVVADVFAANAGSAAFHRRLGFAPLYTILELDLQPDA